MIEFANTVSESEKTILFPMFKRALKEFPELRSKVIYVFTVKEFDGIYKNNTGMCCPIWPVKTLRSDPKCFKLTLVFNKKVIPSMYLIGHELMHIKMRMEGIFRNEFLCDVRTMCLSKTFLDSLPTYLLYTKHENIIENWQKYALHVQYLCKLSLARAVKNNNRVNLSWLTRQLDKINEDDFSNFMSRLVLCESCGKLKQRYVENKCKKCYHKNYYKKCELKTS